MRCFILAVRRAGETLGNKKRSWDLPFLIATTILAIVMFLLAILTLRRGEEEETYEYLLDRRDRLQDELLKLKSMKLEGRISEEEYRKISKRYLKEIRRIEYKLEKIEKRRKKSGTTF